MLHFLNHEQSSRDSLLAKANRFLILSTLAGFTCPLRHLRRDSPKDTNRRLCAPWHFNWKETRRIEISLQSDFSHPSLVKTPPWSQHLDASGGPIEAPNKIITRQHYIASQVTEFINGAALGDIDLMEEVVKVWQLRIMPCLIFNFIQTALHIRIFP